MALFLCQSHSRHSDCNPPPASIFVDVRAVIFAGPFRPALPALSVSSAMEIAVSLNGRREITLDVRNVAEETAAARIGSVSAVRQRFAKLAFPAVG